MKFKHTINKTRESDVIAAGNIQYMFNQLFAGNTGMMIKEGLVTPQFGLVATIADKSFVGQSFNVYKNSHENNSGEVIVTVGEIVLHGEKSGLNFKTLRLFDVESVVMESNDFTVPPSETFFVVVTIKGKSAAPYFHDPRGLGGGSSSEIQDVTLTLKLFP